MYRKTTLIFSVQSSKKHPYSDRAMCKVVDHVPSNLHWACKLSPGSSISVLLLAPSIQRLKRFQRSGGSTPFGMVRVMQCMEPCHLIIPSALTCMRHSSQITIKFECTYLQPIAAVAVVQQPAIRMQKNQPYAASACFVSTSAACHSLSRRAPCTGHLHAERATNKRLAVELVLPHHSHMRWAFTSSICSFTQLCACYM